MVLTYQVRLVPAAFKKVRKVTRKKNARKNVTSMAKEASRMILEAPEQ